MTLGGETESSKPSRLMFSIKIPVFHKNIAFRFLGSKSFIPTADNTHNDSVEMQKINKLYHNRHTSMLQKQILKKL